MNIASWLLIFTFFGLLTSCQVKQTEGGTGLLSGHLPAENEFVLHSPAAGTMVEGDTLTLVLSFPYPVIVDDSGGSPSLGLTIGSNTRSATYDSGDGTKFLTFT